MAIVPTTMLNDEPAYVGLFCVETPDVRFEDTLELTLSTTESTHILDKVFRDICEPESIKVVATATDKAVTVGAFIADDGKLRIVVDPQGLARVRTVVMTVRISGIRKSFRDYRFPTYTADEAKKNTEFWDSAWEQRG